MSERRRVLRFQRLDMIIALGVAGIINMAMLAMAAKLLARQRAERRQLDPAGPYGSEARGRRRGGRVRGGAARLRRLLLERRHVRRADRDGRLRQSSHRLVLRRAITMLPALAVLAIGVDPTSTLILSQVVLSFGIPFALIPLVLFTSTGRSWVSTSTAARRPSWHPRSLP